jgi:hypothetical protein
MHTSQLRNVSSAVSECRHKGFWLAKINATCLESSTLTVDVHGLKSAKSLGGNELIVKSFVYCSFHFQANRILQAFLNCTMKLPQIKQSVKQLYWIWTFVEFRDDYSATVVSLAEQQTWMTDRFKDRCRANEEIRINHLNWTSFTLQRDFCRHFNRFHFPFYELICFSMRWWFEV